MGNRKLTCTEYNYWLYNIEYMTTRKIEKLLQIFGSAEEIFFAKKSEIKAASALNDSEIEILISSRVIEKIMESYAKLEANGIYFVSKEDKRYPAKLKDIYDAPYAIYVKGNLPENNKKTIAIIGARECSSYGKEMAKYMAGIMAKEGVAVISGLARGIDSYAHQGALASGGVTFGVLGCGVDICYPRENINLYMEMQQEGGVISEFPPGTKPLSYHFPMRNRIISGLSDGILVIEAKEKSGSLITVDMGLDQGKEIYALPGRVTDRLSGGCNNLIKMGAKLVTTPKDILEDFLPNYIDKIEENKKNDNLLETDGKIVYACLSLEPKHIEIIAQQTGLMMDRLMEQLVILELQGLVHQTMRNYYIVKH